MSEERSPSKLIAIWLGRVVLGVLALAALIYVGDYAQFLLRGHPQGHVNVTRYMTVPLKGTYKTEYFFEGSGPIACSGSLFPQDGLSPCWYLRRHPLYAEKA